MSVMDHAPISLMKFSLGTGRGGGGPEMEALLEGGLLWDEFRVAKRSSTGQQMNRQK